MVLRSRRRLEDFEGCSEAPLLTQVSEWEGNQQVKHNTTLHRWPTTQCHSESMDCDR